MGFVAVPDDSSLKKVWEVALLFGAPLAAYLFGNFTKAPVNQVLLNQLCKDMEEVIQRQGSMLQTIAKHTSLHERYSEADREVRNTLSEMNRTIGKLEGRMPSRRD
jgi:hypothetical protein